MSFTVLDFEALVNLEGKMASDVLLEIMKKDIDLSQRDFYFNFSAGIVVHLGVKAYERVSSEYWEACLPEFVVRNPYLPKKAAFSFIPHNFQLTPAEGIKEKALVAQEFKNIVED